MFEHFDERARLCIVRTHEETGRLGHEAIGAEHLLLGIAAVDDAIVGVGVERLRAAVVALQGVGPGAEPGWTQFSAEAKAALDGANAQALALGHTTIDPAHLLLAVLDSDGVARRVLRESELTVAEVRERAIAAAGRPAPEGSPSGPPLDEGLRRDDARDLRDRQMLELMLVEDTPAARLLRAHGIDEAAIREALGPRGPAG
jgi:ATP-dependent Clp protease ATP-binding subunit ClpC